MTKYTVQKGHTKVLDEYRGDRIYGDVYIINKDGIAAYEVTVSNLGIWCNCPGGTHHGKCKHTKMVSDYMGAL